MLIGLTISCNNDNSNIVMIILIIYNIWYDFIHKFKDLIFSNNMNIMIICMI